jgi:hypothetical protein
MKISKSASGTLALLFLPYGEYAMKKLFLNDAGVGGSRQSEKMCNMTQETVSQKSKRQTQMRTEYEP